MSRSPAPHFPPPPDSPEVQHALARLDEHFGLSVGLAQVAYGYYRGLSQKEVAAWIGATFSAVHERTRRLFRALGVRTQTGVAGMVGSAIGLPCR